MHAEGADEGRGERAANGMRVAKMKKKGKGQGTNLERKWCCKGRRGGGDDPCMCNINKQSAAMRLVSEWKPIPKCMQSDNTNNRDREREDALESEW